MAITAVFPTITFPNRGVETKDAFVLAQETAQDLLAGDLTTNLTTFKTEANALELNVNTKEASAVAAAASAIAASNFQGTWTSQTTVIGQSWEYSGVIYGVLIAGNTSPIATPSNWFALTIAQSIKNTPAGNIAATTVQGAIDELDTEKAPKTSPIFTGPVSIDTSIIFEGATVDAFQTTLSVIDPTVDQSILIPDKSGTMALTSDISSKIQPIYATVAANALTVTLNPTTLDFRSATLGDGTVTTITTLAPISMTISSGSTLGTVNGVAARLMLIAINNAGTMELAIVNSGGGLNLDGTTLISTTAEGGAGAADSASVIYSTSARTNVPFGVVGFIDITEATAGTWVTAPSEIQGAGGEALTNTFIKSLLNASGSAPLYACRAWVNFNGTGTVAIRASGNVSSITDNGIGDYIINFTTIMQDVNYSAVGTASRLDAIQEAILSAYSFSTSSVTVSVNDNGSAAIDANHCSIAIFR